MTASIKIEHTRKVTRIAHIHSIGNGSYRRTWSINSGLQILIEDIVTVIGSSSLFTAVLSAVADIILMDGSITNIPIIYFFIFLFEEFDCKENYFIPISFEVLR